MLKKAKKKHLTLQQVPLPYSLLSDYDQNLPTTESTLGIQNQNVKLSSPIKKKELSTNKFFSLKSMHTSTSRKSLEEPEDYPIVSASDLPTLFPCALLFESTKVKHNSSNSSK